MGYGEDASDDGDEDGFEEELAAILGGNIKKTAKKPQPKCEYENLIISILLIL